LKQFATNYFYVEGLLAPRPTLKLQDHHLSAVCDCLFSIFAATLRIWRPSLHPHRNKKREYLKGKIHELETNNKNKNIRDLYRGINEFKKGYQPRINIIKEDNGNMIADPQSVLNRWKNFFK
jgi:hypothetical protein